MAQCIKDVDGNFLNTGGRTSAPVAVRKISIPLTEKNNW